MVLVWSSEVLLEVWDRVVLVFGFFVGLWYFMVVRVLVLFVCVLGVVWIVFGFCWGFSLLSLRDYSGGLWSNCLWDFGGRGSFLVFLFVGYSVLVDVVVCGNVIIGLVNSFRIFFFNNSLKMRNGVCDGFL